MILYCECTFFIIIIKLFLSDLKRVLVKTKNDKENHEIYLL